MQISTYFKCNTKEGGESQSPTSPSPPSITFSTSIPSDPLELALLSASACSFVGPPHLESEALSVVMNYVMTCPVSTVVHIPCSVCPLLARVLSTEFRNAISSVWGFMRLFLFAKLALRMPPLRQRRRHFILPSVLLDRLHLWSQLDGLYNLWEALQDDLHVSRSSHCIKSSKHNISRALFWAREGRYSNAVQSLTSTGVADKNDDLAFQELLQRHPVSDPPSCSAPKTASLVVDESAVLICLKGFPRGTSPGASGLRTQHLLDAVSGHTAPSAELCLTTLTRLITFCFLEKLLHRLPLGCVVPL